MSNINDNSHSPIGSPSLSPSQQQQHHQYPFTTTNCFGGPAKPNNLFGSPTHCFNAFSGSMAFVPNNAVGECKSD